MKKHLPWILAIAVLGIGCSSQNNEPQSTTGSTAESTTGSSTGGATTAGTASATGYAAVQAIFTQNCVGCHGGSRPKGKIDLTSYEGVMKGGEDGPIVTPGNPDKSKLIDALRGRNGAMQMPKGTTPLPEDQIKVVEDWIKAGAKNS